MLACFLKHFKCYNEQKRCCRKYTQHIILLIDPCIIELYSYGSGVLMTKVPVLMSVPQT